MERNTFGSLCLVILLSGGSCSPIYYRQMDSRRRDFITRQEYIQERNFLLKSEENMRVGHDIVLDSTELRVNQILMHYKEAEINKSRTSGAPFPPSVHFFKSKPMIETSDVFKIIRKMPKGGVLHLHDCSMVDINWLVKNATYRDNCYMCTDKNGYMYFRFSSHPPQNATPCQNWRLVKTERSKSGDVNHFDQQIYNNLSLIVDDPVKSYPNINTVWIRFLQSLDQAKGLINHEPVFRDYFYEALQEFSDDNVQYLEFRGLLPETYDLSGNKNGKDWALKVYDQVFTEFTNANKQKFSGGKFIYSSLRTAKETDILGEVIRSMKYLSQYPKHFAGYDLVGQEDLGIPLYNYLDALLYPGQQSPPFNLPYFFHAGETDWEGTPTDRNLIDAVLLNTTRIGHGYAMVKHPVVMQTVLNKSIAIEVNPISNQVLKLLDDLRNHPAADLLAQGFPVVISADDLGVWGARGLSYDFYMTFMGLAGETADLRMLKQLAINSIKYSAMTSQEKVQAMNLWKFKWSQFLQQILHDYQPFNYSGGFMLGNPLG